MVFLASVSILGWLSLMPYFVRAFRGPGLTRPEFALAAVSFMGTAAALAPVMLELGMVGREASGASISLDQSATLQLVLLATGGVLSIIAFAARLLRLRRAPEARFSSVGVNTLGLAIGVYLCVVVVDQVRFLRASGDDVGMLAWSIVRTEFRDTVKDVRCDSEVMIVRGVESGVATYRCPHLPQITLARYSATPIFAWPAYEESRSAQLAQALRQLTPDSATPARRD